MEPHEFAQLPGERKIILISAVLGIVLFVAYVVGRKKPASAVSESQDAGGGGATSYDPNAELNASKEVSLASIAHSAELAFSLNSSAISHDLGEHSSSGGGSGGISFGGFSLGGGGYKMGGDQWDLLTQHDLVGGFSGSNLSEDEFQMLIQEGQALVNAAAASQAANNAVGLDKLSRYKAPPAPGKAPKGMHLEIGENGQSYWVRDGAHLHA